MEHQSFRLTWVSLFAIGLLSLAATGAYWLGTRSGSGHPQLLVDAGALDFGEVWETQALKWDLRIHNPGDDNVDIGGFSTSCACLNVVPAALTVPGHGTATVSLTLNLVAKRDSADTALTREFSTTIWPRLLGHSAELAWTLRGKVRVAYDLEPRSIDFGEVAVSRASEASRAICLRSHVAVKELRVTCPAEFADARSIEGPGNHQILVSLSKRLPVGLHSFEATIAPILNDGTALPEMKIPVRAQVVHDIGFVPRSVHFGFKRIGEDVEELVILRSLSGRPFRVLTVSSPEGSKIAPMPASDEEQNERRFFLRQRILLEGNQSSKLRITVVQHEGQPTDLTLEVGYFGAKN